MLDQLIKERKDEVRSYEEYLKLIIELTKQVKDPGTSSKYPRTINSNAKRALFDNLDNNEASALAIDESIRNSKPHDWRNTKIKRRTILYAIKKFIDDEETAEIIFKIAEEQGEY